MWMENYTALIGNIIEQKREYVNINIPRRYDLSVNC
jgi:hypothetical protein